MPICNALAFFYIIFFKLHANGCNNSQQCCVCLHVAKSLIGFNFVQQLPAIATTCNMVCKLTQRVTSNNVGSCWPIMLHLFAPGFTHLCEKNRLLAVCLFSQNMSSSYISQRDCLVYRSSHAWVSRAVTSQRKIRDCSQSKKTAFKETLER